MKRRARNAHVNYLLDVSNSQNVDEQPSRNLLLLPLLFLLPLACSFVLKRKGRPDKEVLVSWRAKERAKEKGRKKKKIERCLDPMLYSGISIKVEGGRG